MSILGIGLGIAVYIIALFFDLGANLLVVYSLIRMDQWIKFLDFSLVFSKVMFLLCVSFQSLIGFIRMINGICL